MNQNLLIKKKTKINVNSCSLLPKVCFLTVFQVSVKDTLKAFCRMFDLHVHIHVIILSESHLHNYVT